jgi:hypothetical protein
MKKFSLFSLVVIFVFVGTALASGSPPGSGWWSGEQIQNVGGDTAEVTVTAYDSASSSTYVASKSISSGGSATFLPADFTGMPDGFMGSAVVASTQDIRAIVNVTNRQAGSYGVSGGLAAAQYQGMNAGDTTLNFPLAKNDFYGKTTTFYIQNAGSSAATASVTFYVGANSYPYTTPSISPGAMVAVQPTDAGMTSGNTNGLGSMKVSSTTSLAGVVLEHKTTENPGTLLQATRGFASGDADDLVFAPIIKNNYYDRFTGLQVQNVNASGNVDITVTYSAVDGCSGTFTDSATGVAPGTSHTFVHLTATDLPSGCLATAKVEVTGGNVVAIVNESFVPGYAGTQQSTTYSALPDVSATTKVSVPLYKEYSYGKWTGLQVQNVGSATASNVVLTFSGPTGTYVSNPLTIAPSAGVTFVDVRLKPATFWNGTAMTPTALGCTASGCAGNGVFGVTVTADQNVVAIANESPYPFAATLVNQDKNNYEGFNLTP